MFTNPFAKFIAYIYHWLISIFSNLQSIFIFLMRITWGHLFFLAGYGKLTNIDKVADFFGTLGFPFPTFHASLVASIELIGGLLLVVGFASRLSALSLAIIMVGAYSTAHSHVFTHLAFISDPSLIVKEAPFAYLLTSLIVLLFGPGKISIDAYLKKKFEE